MQSWAGFFLLQWFLLWFSLIFIFSNLLHSYIKSIQFEPSKKIEFSIFLDKFICNYTFLNNSTGRFVRAPWDEECKISLRACSIYSKTTLNLCFAQSKKKKQANKKNALPKLTEVWCSWICFLRKNEGEYSKNTKNIILSPHLLRPIWFFKVFFACL